MWGGLNDVPPYPAGAEDPLSHMANAAKVADEQVGRIIAKLKAEGTLDETLVVLTTDHAQLTAAARTTTVSTARTAATTTGTTARDRRRPT